MAVVVAVMISQLVSQICFVPSPQLSLRGRAAEGASAAVGSSIVVAPLAANAYAEQTYDGFGPGEQLAIFIPIALVGLALNEWCSQQEPVPEDIGGTLYQMNDGPNGYRPRGYDWDESF